MTVQQMLSVQSTLLFLGFWCYVLAIFLYLAHVLAVEPAGARLSLGYSTVGGGSAVGPAPTGGTNLKLLFGRGATALAWTGWLMHASGLGLRWLAQGHFPVASAFEAPLAFSLGIVGIYLVAERAIGTRVAGWISLGIAVALMFYSLFTFSAGSTVIEPLKPALRSVWLQIHVSIAIFSYSFFAFSGAMGLAYLLRLRPERPVALSSARNGAPSGGRRPWPGGSGRVELPGRGHRVAPDRFYVDVGRRVGADGLVHLLDLGPQGGVGADHLPVLCYLYARASGSRVAWPPHGYHGRRGLWRRHLQLFGAGGPGPHLQYLQPAHLR